MAHKKAKGPVLPLKKIDNKSIIKNAEPLSSLRLREAKEKLKIAGVTLRVYKNFGYTLVESSNYSYNLEKEIKVRKKNAKIAIDLNRDKLPTSKKQVIQFEYDALAKTFYELGEKDATFKFQMKYVEIKRLEEELGGNPLRAYKKGMLPVSRKLQKK